MTASGTGAPFATDTDLVDAYLGAEWGVQTSTGTLTVRLDGTRPDPQLRPSGIVTAYNPASILRSAEENEAADTELLRHVRSLGVPYRRTVARGEAPGSAAWEEPGYLLLGEVRPLLVELGLVFGQNAIVWIDAAGDVSLVCTRSGFAGRLPGQKISD
jgi:hypothetical protein